MKSHPNSTEAKLTEAPLGKKSAYENHYNPSLLFPVPRMLKRDEIGITGQLPFKGYDIWNGFEISWLNLKGKPTVAVGEFRFPCDSPNIIESKSFKLYLNSFNNSQFESFEQVRTLMIDDLSKNAGAPVEVQLFKMNEVQHEFAKLAGQCLDELDVECSSYQPDLSTLFSEGPEVEETLYSDLLKSNCLVTGQPDWASLQIEYKGQKINPEGLLKYIVSLRDHNEFHEQCVERIFMDILRTCKPKTLSVYARYTRRGGLDINPFRTNRETLPRMNNFRLIRQ